MHDFSEKALHFAYNSPMLASDIIYFKVHTNIYVCVYKNIYVYL